MRSLTAAAPSDNVFGAQWLRIGLLTDLLTYRLRKTLASCQICARVLLEYIILFCF